jgi:hypothetical protein
VSRAISKVFLTVAVRGRCTRWRRSDKGFNYAQACGLPGTGINFMRGHIDANGTIAVHEGPGRYILYVISGVIIRRPGGRFSQPREDATGVVSPRRRAWRWQPRRCDPSR